MRFPDSVVSEPEYGLWPIVGEEPRSLLLAWHRDEDAVPERLLDLWRGICGNEISAEVATTVLTAPFEHSTQQTYALRVVVMPMCDPFITVSR